jgi:NADPH2:quinone reductase
MTRVVKIEKTGGPEVLKLETINLEKPAPQEVTIEHKAIGLNFIDTYHRSGLYPIELPSGIGAEGAGVIKEVGSKVDGFSVGDKVAYAGAPLGAYSSERNYPIKNLVKIPDFISCEIAATLMTKGLTAYYLLFKTYPVSSNETLLFHAAAGGVGQIFCQWAKSLGCKVIGTVGSDEKINIAKKNGCDFIINYSKDDFAKKVLEFTKEKGVPVVYDGVGKNTFHKSIECLKTRGMMVSFGNASGSLEDIDVKKSIQPKGLYFTRPAMGHYLRTRDEIQDGADKLFKAVKLGKIKVEIFKKYRLDDVVQAHKDLESRKITGPAVIIP